MDFRQLEAFVTVVSTGSMTAAAGVLGTSQPTVTRLVQELENSLGLKLLSRNGPRINPTREGLEFYTDAERLLAAVERVKGRASDIANAAPRSIELAAISAVGVTILPRALARVEDSRIPPSVRLSIQSAEAVPQLVMNGQADLGFSNPPLDHPGLEIIGAYVAPCVMAVGSDDPLAQQEKISINSLKGRRIASLGDRYRFRRKVFEALRERDIHVAAEITCSSTVAALHVIQAGLAIGVVEPLTAFGLPLEGVEIRPLEEEILFAWSVISAEGHAQIATLRELVEAHEQEVASRVPGFRSVDKSDQRAILSGKK